MIVKMQGSGHPVIWTEELRDVFLAVSHRVIRVLVGADLANIENLCMLLLLVLLLRLLPLLLQLLLLVLVKLSYMCSFYPIITGRYTAS